MAIDIASMVELGLKDARASGSRISSAWGNLALSLAGAAGAVGISALEKKANAGTAGTDVVTHEVLTTPGQPTEKKKVPPAMNKAAVDVGLFVLLLAVGGVWFAFKG